MDDAPRMISPKQIKAARVFLDWEQKDLARAAGLSLPTIQRMEKLGVERSAAVNAEAVRRALEVAGVEFIPENGGGAGVRLRKAPAKAPSTPAPMSDAALADTGLHRVRDRLKAPGRFDGPEGEDRD